MATYDIDRGLLKSRRKLHYFIPVIALIGVFAGGYAIYKNPKASTAVSQPVSAQAQVPQTAKLTQPLPWPAYGQSAYGVAGNGVMATSNDSAKSVPVASLAKVVTALAVLKHKPLQNGEQGPTITLTQKDINLYEEYVRKGGAVVPVEVGEQISQYQALQAMLMSSANNMADSLVIWAFGSVEAYNSYANIMINEWGLTKTAIADASGFSSSTVSTANEMTQLGIRYMQDPVLKQIAMQPQADISFAGAIKNYNAVANKDGITGIKVGNTDEAGRCFMVADIRSNTLSVVTVLGADSLDIAIKDSLSAMLAGNNAYDKLP